jgi:hypothetical protein
MPVPESRNFQFEKPIPGGAENMRIEFMAPEEFKRENDFRVDIQNGVHARACMGDVWCAPFYLSGLTNQQWSQSAVIFEYIREWRRIPFAEFRMRYGFSNPAVPKLYQNPIQL